MLRWKSRVACQTGMTIAEFMVVFAILGLLCGIGVAQMKLMAGGLNAGSDQVVSISKTARAYAMSHTTPHRVVPTTDTKMSIEYGGPCNDAFATWTPLAGSDFDLPEGIRLQSTSWNVCFNTRGWTTDAHNLRLLEGNSYQDVSVLLGGSVRVGEVHRY